ncbi:hypothetical protein G8764_00345 [Pseudomaricurvus alcaniphilus]|uniref:hypothetical protein n=1 Tax=Pseudomaricurvus alcaniphilus TaxID=1166482 RepID=UPI001409E538|nr:hypothetical protein [Pseudomaricurvus alcaniphilus]NHN35739.1 hypothetical protein [Pseudomaricurvus alcaniphilus]
MKVAHIIVFLLMFGLSLVIGFGIYNSGRIAALEQTGKSLLGASNKAGAAAPSPVTSPSLAAVASSAPALAQTTVPTLRTTLPLQPAPGISSATRVSVPDQKVLGANLPPAQSRSDNLRQRREDQAIFNKLQETCNNWTRWYNQDQKEVSRLNMNSACKQSADFARSHLNQRIRPNYVAYNASKPKSGGGAILINGEESSSDSSGCENLKNRIKRINNQLRAGYTMERGNRLRAQRRELENRVHEAC